MRSTHSWILSWDTVFGNFTNCSTISSTGTSRICSTAPCKIRSRLEILSSSVMSSYSRTSAAANCAVSAPSPGDHLCSLVPSRKFPHQIRLALSGAWREPKASFGSRPPPTLLLRLQIRAFIHPAAARNTTHPSPTSQLCSLYAVADPCSPGSGTSNSSPPMLAPAKTWEVDAQEWSQRARSLLIQAALWRPAWPNATSSSRPLQSFPIETTRTPARWSGQAALEHQLSPPQPVVRRSCRLRHRDGYQAQ